MEKRPINVTSLSNVSGQPIEAITDKPLIGFEEPGLFYVNSGQSLGRNKMDAFPEATLRGAVQVGLLEREIGNPVKTTEQGSGYVPGRVTIRQVVEREIREQERANGKNRAVDNEEREASRVKRKANRVLKELTLRLWRGIVEYIPYAAIQQHLTSQPERLKEERHEQAAHARKYKR
jgi:hypothetical protein